MFVERPRAVFHEVLNQLPARVGTYEFAENGPPVEGVKRHDAECAPER
jgi:hypothetical protein